MDNAKKKVVAKFSRKIVFLFLVIFPFGQLLRIQFSILGKPLTLHLIDVVVGLSLPFSLLNLLKVNKVYKSMLAFLALCVFSLLVSLAYFTPFDVLLGSFYLFRLFAYSTFFLLVWNMASSKPSYKNILFKGLLLVSIFTAIFGWIQYFWMPDLRFLKTLKWDDHLGRLAGTFLDPGFTSIVLVLGFLSTFSLFLKKRKKSLIAILIFLIVSVAFTYARAAYLALFVGMLCFLYWQKKKVAIVLISAIFLLLIPLLPRTSGEGVRLERSYSIRSKIENYRETIEIIRKNPLFGVGFNNLCPARIKLFGGRIQSHSCAGADSSLLLVLATTGVVGSLIFINIVFVIFRSLDNSIYSKAFLACSLALLIHSLFVNSMFYPWVMGWMLILLGISMKKSKV
jgi:O-antigen ligase